MGLGKSLSMVALIAINPAEGLVGVVVNPQTRLTPVKTTLLVVPTPCLCPSYPPQ